MLTKQLNLSLIKGDFVINEHTEYGTFYSIKHALTRCLELGAGTVYLDKSLGTFQWNGSNWVLL